MWHKDISNDFLESFLPKSSDCFAGSWPRGARPHTLPWCSHLLGLYGVTLQTPQFWGPRLHQIPEKHPSFCSYLEKKRCWIHSAVPFHMCALSSVQQHLFQPLLTVSVPFKDAFGTQVSLRVITRCSYLSIPLISGTKSELTRELGWIYT